MPKRPVGRLWAGAETPSQMAENDTFYPNQCHHPLIAQLNLTCIRATVSLNWLSNCSTVLISNHRLALNPVPNKRMLAIVKLSLDILIQHMRMLKQPSFWLTSMVPLMAMVKHLCFFPGFSNTFMSWTEMIITKTSSLLCIVRSILWRFGKKQFISFSSLWFSSYKQPIRIPNFYNDFFVYLLFEYFYQVKLLNQD